MRNLTLRSGSLTGEEMRVGAPLTLSFNAQQYASTAPAFEYYGDPTVSSITPTSGPRAGGTQLLIAGRHLVGGSTYRCAIAAGWSPQLASPQPDGLKVFVPQQVASLELTLTPTLILSPSPSPSSSPSLSLGPSLSPSLSLGPSLSPSPSLSLNPSPGSNPKQAASLEMPLVYCATPPADAATELVTPQLSNPNT